ncbi:MAG: acetyl-CoA carboxylase biotin carboxylase subunit [Chlamydiales bacterium]|jgi:acetyl-CoA carboxylase biotin carboxylase subunit
MFTRILIANRGEIALRIIRSAREMGIECVAIYSDLDRRALHTRMAHVAVGLGGGPPADTYLSQERILAAALESGCQAIHPGYGFLSENAEFARRVVDAGLVWIGPPPDAIATMGDKVECRRAMTAAGVPIVPGAVDPVESPEDAAKQAAEIGLPVALKAAAGGGGKGIRIVHEIEKVAGAFRVVTGEAQAAFGDGRLYLERYLERPRHIEVQVLFDQHGNGVHFGERECSVQRRHQKLIEECPSPVVDDDLRQRMGEAALAAARAVDYEGAGTVEFLYSGGEFFFLEMNTRLQVEHPVTEMVTGVDLVREQLRIAAGEPLGYELSDIDMRGHAIEVRINAEDSQNGFLPSTGVLKNLRVPGGAWVRLDSAMHTGLEVGTTYDPMLAKLIVWGADRDQAIARMVRALEELNVGGVLTSAPAALQVLQHEDFRRGEYDTHFLESLTLAPARRWEPLVAATAAIFRHQQAVRRGLTPAAEGTSGWLLRSRRGTSEFSRLAGERFGSRGDDA